MEKDRVRLGNVRYSINFSIIAALTTIVGVLLLIAVLPVPTDPLLLAQSAGALIELFSVWLAVKIAADIMAERYTMDDRKKTVLFVLGIYIVMTIVFMVVNMVKDSTSAVTLLSAVVDTAAVYYFANKYVRS